MTAKEMLAQAILSSKALLTRYVAGFDDESRTKQTEHQPNHVIWCLGHCALTMHRVAERIDGKPLPKTDFVTRTGTAGTPNTFDTESVAFNSTPADDASRYPTLTRGITIYEGACDRLAEAVRTADEATLDRTIPWGNAEISLWLLATRLIFHNGTHAGQITDLRRALRLDRILG